MKNIIMSKKAFIKTIMTTLAVIILTLLLFPSAINLDIAKGIAIVAIVIKSEYVGMTIAYKLTPSSKMILVYRILMINPKHFVTNPPKIKIIVDDINLFFMRSPLKILLIAI